MEPHRQDLKDVEKYRPDIKAGPHEYFRKAYAFALNFYGEEMDNIRSVDFNQVTPELFFREYIWVVHATGFSAKAVGTFFPRISAAYGSWNDLGKEDFNQAFERVKLVCNNPQKAKAVHATARWLVEELSEKRPSWDALKLSNLGTPELLTKLPYIGKITCFHLGRNIGLLECVKPDLHLIRLAKFWGFKDCKSMCEELRPDGMPLGIVDLILWYACSTFGTLEIRAEGDR